MIDDRDEVAHGQEPGAHALAVVEHLEVRVHLDVVHVGEDESNGAVVVGGHLAAELALERLVLDVDDVDLVVQGLAIEDPSRGISPLTTTHHPTHHHFDTTTTHTLTPSTSPHTDTHNKRTQALSCQCTNPSTVWPSLGGMHCATCFLWALSGMTSTCRFLQEPHPRANA